LPPPPAVVSTVSPPPRSPGTPPHDARAPSGAVFFGPHPTSTRGWWSWSVDPSPGPGPPVRRSSPSSTQHSHSAARPCAPHWQGGPARRPQPKVHCGQQGSTPPHEVSPLTSRGSPPSPNTVPEELARGVLPSGR